jgi:hypothetical protein
MELDGGPVLAPVTIIIYYKFHYEKFLLAISGSVFVVLYGYLYLTSLG